MAESATERPNWLPADCEILADGEYDAIVMGTGLKEAVISGLLSTKKMKVLHVDRNNYYGGECASLNLTNLYQKFRPGTTPPEILGHPTRDYNVDLIPKFIIACGNLVKMLLHTKVTRYLDFKNVDGSYVYKAGKILKVPATPEEALRTSLMGIFEKRRFKSFLTYLSKYEEGDPSTHGGLDLKSMTMLQLYDHYSLDKNTQSFVGHAMGLMRDDNYLEEPALPTVKAIQLYCYSLERYGKSPYIYPMYGLGGLPEGFSRLCAVHGGTFMLQCPVNEVLFDESGKAWGICASIDGKKQVAKAPVIIGDPSYFSSEMVRSLGSVVRSICILDHPIASTGNAESTQIIIPGLQVGRKHDIYVCMVSHSHNVASEGKFIAIASTTVETSDPSLELKPAFDLIGPVLDRFDAVSEAFEPVGSGKDDGCFISSSYDATSHFETTSQDILSLYERITGEKLDLTINADSTEAED
mmetsp:Transcript_4060/g.6202  ORF Transcript_4060/g.6202 Transcript_4060/m.6202 type:complete len:468 (-) Transcript_4060:31-1434(-)